MCVIGIDEVLRRVKDQKLIENLSERELNNPEGVGVDLRLGEVHEIIEGGAFIEADGPAGLGLRKGVKTRLLAEFKKGRKKQQIVEIEPSKYYLLKTVEITNTPKDLISIPYGRASLMKSGLFLIASKVDPGYSGHLVFGLKNFSDFPVRLQMGARVCNLAFHKVEGESVMYRGQHMGGRIAIEKEERQV